MSILETIAMSKIYHILNMEALTSCARLLNYYAYGIAVFILTVRQRKKQKPDTKN